MLKCWAPNNRQWFLGWLFALAVPPLNLFITNGDGNESTQIDYALDARHPNAIWCRCGWHIVDRGWVRHLSSTLGVKSKHTNFSAVCDFISCIKGWLCSLMKDTETWQEHFILKAALLQHVLPAAAAKLIGQKMQSHLVDFLSNCVFSVESHFAHHNFLTVRGLGGWTSAPLEGMSNGLKHCKNNAQPGMALADSTRSLIKQDSERLRAKMKAVSNWIHSSRRHEESPHCSFITKEAQGEMERQRGLCHSCISCRWSLSSWLVSFASKRNTAGTIPAF